MPFQIGRVAAGVLIACATLYGQSGYTPARLQTGTMRLPLPPQAVGGGQVWIEARVGPSGAVVSTEILQTLEPFGAMLQATVQGWRFQPARLDDERVEAAVLVAGVFRPPSLFVFGDPGIATAPATGGGEGPRPTVAVMPPYPTTGRGSPTVIVEVTLGASGEVTGADVWQPGGAVFDEAALDTARRWRFTPGRRAGRTVDTYVYLVFVFREPVVPTSPRD